MKTPSMDDKDTPSPPQRNNWQYQADKLLGANAPPWPSDTQRLAALRDADLLHWAVPPKKEKRHGKAKGERREVPDHEAGRAPRDKGGAPGAGVRAAPRPHRTARR